MSCRIYLARRAVVCQPLSLAQLSLNFRTKKPAGVHATAVDKEPYKFELYDCYKWQQELVTNIIYLALTINRETLYHVFWLEKGGRTPSPLICKSATSLKLSKTVHRFSTFKLSVILQGLRFLHCSVFAEQILSRGMKDGYHTAKVEWLKDQQIPEEESGKFVIQWCKINVQLI